jgi:hypothetical protein
VNPTGTSSPKLPETPARPNADDLLSREIGVRQLAATIFNYTVGSGIFVIPAFAAARLGSAAILAYIVCALIMGLMVVCFAEAGSRVSTTGGAYAYMDAAFGPFVGFLGGVLLLFVDLTATAAVATIFAQSLLALFDAPSSRVLVMATAGVALAAVAAINIAGVKRGVLLVEILVAAKLIPLAVFVLAGGIAVHTENLRWTTTPTFSSVAATSGFLIFAFLGIEGALTPSGEVRTPSRTVPRAAFFAIAAVTALYIAVQLVAQGLLGPALADDRVAPLATAMAVAIGPLGRTLILTGHHLDVRLSLEQPDGRAATAIRPRPRRVRPQSARGGSSRVSHAARGDRQLRRDFSRAGVFRDVRAARDPRQLERLASVYELRDCSLGASPTRCARQRRTIPSARRTARDNPGVCGDRLGAD